MPAYLEGLLAPVSDEITATDLPVTGAIPAQLTGRYFRNGPNPAPHRDPGHWFAGDGMLHGVRLRDGKAEWYRNRWVRTGQLTGKEFRTETGVDRTAVSANTSVIRHADKIFALVENGFPYEITSELDTIGPCHFGGRLTSSMNAHPKEDPVTGELHFFGTSPQPPFVTYYRLNRHGDLVESRPISVGAPTMMHDLALTENHVIFLDLPMVFDMQRISEALPYSWSDDHGARLGVMPRAGGDVRWFEIAPCYVFHVGNAHEVNGQIVLDAVRYTRERITAFWNEMGGTPNPALEAGGTTLHRWSFDPVTGVVREEQRDDREIEFPTFNENLLGRSSKYLYTVSSNAVVKYNTTTGESHVRELGKAPGEAAFVPAPGAVAEDEGWLLSIVTDHDGSGSELRIMDALDLEDVASVQLPRRVPAGFHGEWLADE